MDILTRIMPIRFLCRECSARIKVADGTEGRKVKCPKCGASQRVPHPHSTEIEGPSTTPVRLAPPTLNEQSSTPTTIDAPPPAPLTESVSYGPPEEENNPLAALAAAASGSDHSAPSEPNPSLAVAESLISQPSTASTTQEEETPIAASAAATTPQASETLSSVLATQSDIPVRNDESASAQQTLSEPETPVPEPETPSIPPATTQAPVSIETSVPPQDPAPPETKQPSEAKEPSESLDLPAPAVVPSPVRPLPKVIPMVGGAAAGLSATRPGVTLPKPIPLATHGGIHADTADGPHASQAMQGIPLVDEAEQVGSGRTSIHQPAVRQRPFPPVPAYAGLLWVSWLLMGFAVLVGFVSILTGLMYLIRSGDGMALSQVLGLVLVGVLFSVLLMGAALVLQALRDLTRNSHRSG